MSGGRVGGRGQAGVNVAGGRQVGRWQETATGGRVDVRPEVGGGRLSGGRAGGIFPRLGRARCIAGSGLGPCARARGPARALGLRRRSFATLVAGVVGVAAVLIAVLAVDSPCRHLCRRRRHVWLVVVVGYVSAPSSSPPTHRRRRRSRRSPLSPLSLWPPSLPDICRRCHRRRGPRRRSRRPLPSPPHRRHSCGSRRRSVVVALVLVVVDCHRSLHNPRRCGRGRRRRAVVAAPSSQPCCRCRRRPVAPPRCTNFSGSGERRRRLVRAQNFSLCCVLVGRCSVQLVPSLPLAHFFCLVSQWLDSLGSESTSAMQPGRQATGITSPPSC